MPVYGTRISTTVFMLSIRKNMIPLFYEDGKLHTTMKLEEIKDNRLVFKWSDRDKDAWIAMRHGRTNVQGGVMIIQGRRLVEKGVQVSSLVGLEPVRNGIVLRLDGQVGLTPDPQITAVSIKRIRFLKPKHIPANALESYGLYRWRPMHIYLSNRKVYSLIRRYTAVSHVGGTTLLFNNNPLSIRSPYLPVKHVKRYTGEETYMGAQLFIPLNIAGSMGWAGRTFHCLDMIEDIEGRHYIRFGGEDECMER